MSSDIPDLDSWLSRILDGDAATFEDAYWGARPEARIAVPRLLQLLQATHDPFTRGKLLELLGESGDPSVAEVLRAELTHPAEDMRQWAGLALGALERGAPWQPQEWQ